MYINPSKYIIFKNGEIIDKMADDNDVLWGGAFSTASFNGSIVQFVTEYLKKINKSTLFILIQSDVNILYEHLKNDCITNNENVIVATVAQKKEDDRFHYLYVPQDDGFFENGISHYFQNIPSWNERKAIAYWRGGCSGGGYDSIRCRVVEHLLNYDKADVKYTYIWWKRESGIPEHFLSNIVDYTEFLKYKIFMIIDGNGIASNHMWGFASGGVPFMISNTKCWFYEFLVPFVNYIPIQYDLSDLKEKIEWVINNDSEAEMIAQNALQFSREVFSSEFQKKYLMDKINQFVGI